MLGGVSVSLRGELGMRSSGTVGCGTSVIILRASTWGSLTTSDTRLMGPQGTPAWEIISTQSAMGLARKISLRVPTHSARWADRSSFGLERGSSIRSVRPMDLQRRSHSPWLAQPTMKKPSAAGKVWYGNRLGWPDPMRCGPPPGAKYHAGWYI